MTYRFHSINIDVTPDGMKSSTDGHWTAKDVNVALQGMTTKAYDLR